MSKWENGDWERTKEVISGERPATKDGKTWLRHSKDRKDGSSYRIDLEVLKGTSSVEEIAKAVGCKVIRVVIHLDHLRERKDKQTEPHHLKIKKVDRKVMFDVGESHDENRDRERLHGGMTKASPQAGDENQISLSMDVHDQSSELHTESETGQATPSEELSWPEASDLADPPVRTKTVTYRIVRDTIQARRLKELYQHECQLCGTTIQLSGGQRYSEAHHIRPLGGEHLGPDIAENTIVLCPNHHAMLDLGAIRLAADNITLRPGHGIAREFIQYHNSVIDKGRL